MQNVLKLYHKHWNSPKRGWLWLHDYPPDVVKIYFVVSAICDWFFWHCVMHNYKSLDIDVPDCSVRKACEMMDILNDHIEIEFDQSNSLSELLWNHIDFPAFELLVDGAARDDRSISEISSSLFCWPRPNSAGALVLEEYFERTMTMRSQIFNQGNYHDSMNWLDIYDMELNATYSDWVQSKQPALTWEIRRKLRCIRRYMSYPLEEQIRRQWCCEASHLGLSEQQSKSHWELLRKYLLEKIQYHRARIDLIESAMGSRFYPRYLYSGIEGLTYDFGCIALDFLEARIELLNQNRPLQLKLL